MGKHYDVSILGASLRRWHLRRDSSLASGWTGPSSGWVVEINMYLINLRWKDHCKHDASNSKYQYACEQDGCGHFLEFQCSVESNANTWVAASVHSSLNWIRPVS